MFENGSEVLRFDCHLHTVIDKEFKYEGEKDKFISDYVDKMRAEGISVGVITNYNKFDCDQYKAIKKVAKKNDIFIFSERAVAGMMRNRETMNKGRAQDVTKPCNTVGAHLAKVSLNSTDPVLFTKGRYRRFTPREVARIQSFPENFSLSGSESAQYRALGNAIPPVMFWYVANKISECLDAAI